MDIDGLIRGFERIGARALVGSRLSVLGPSLDVRRDAKGEYFDLRVPVDVDLRAVDVRPEMRHLLLKSETASGQRSKFLCGHDERHWFVAGVPLDRGVSGVATAMEALKPRAVREAQERAGVGGDKRARRKTAAYVRQGEWFFVPRPGAAVDRRFIVRGDVLSRGPRSKPHRVDELVRTGGETVYVSHIRPQGATEEEYRRLAGTPEHRSVQWRVMRRNPDVLVRGRIRHPDHATVVLSDWHEVRMNEEHRAPGRESVVFLD